MKYLFLLMTIMLPIMTKAAPQWLWSETVQFSESHDPSLIVLKNGQQLTMEYTGHVFDTVYQWKAGKPLILGFSENTGTVLFDEKDGTTIPVTAGMTKYPIDIMLDNCLQTHTTTPEMEGCYSQATTLWDKQMNISYRAVLSKLDHQHQKAVQISQLSWIKYRDAQIKAVAAIYDQDGTIWRIVAAEKIMNITKDQALRLESFRAW